MLQIGGCLPLQKGSLSFFPCAVLYSLLFLLGVAAPASAQVIVYANGFDNSTPISAGSDATLEIDQTATQSGIITDSGTPGFVSIYYIGTQPGAGTMIFTANNTYTGGTSVKSGVTLQIGKNGTTGSILGNIDDEGTLAFDRIDAYTFGGDISGNGSVTEIDTPTTTLTGSNTYAGGTQIEQGTLQFANRAAMSPTGTITVSGGATLAVNAGGSGEFTNATSGKGSIGGLLSGQGTGVSSVISFASGSFLGIDTTNAGGSLTYSADITNSGLGLIKIGSGALILSGTNTYSGGTVISNGTLQFAHTYTMPASNLTVDTGATLAVNAGGTAEFTNGTSGKGSIGGLLSGIGSQIGSTVLFGPGTFLGIDTTNAGGSLTYAGNIPNSGLGITKLGTGTLVLTGSNTYNGGTNINGGALQVTSDSNLGTGDISMSGGELITSAFNFSTNKNITLNTGTNTIAGIIGSNATFRGTITGSGALAVGDATHDQNHVYLTGPDTYSGGTTIAPSNYLYIGNGGATGSIVGDVSLGFSGGLIFNRSDAVTFGGTISGQGQVAQSGSGTTTLTGSNTYSEGTQVTNGTLQFAKLTAMSPVGNVFVYGGATLAVNAGGTGEFSNATSGNGSIGGLLAGLGSQSPSTVTFFSGSFLGIDTTNAGGSLTYAGNITNSGLGITKLGTGTLVLAGSNTYNGGTNISGGTLQVSSDSNLGTGDISMNGGALIASGLTFSTNKNITLTGANAFAVTGGSPPTLGGATLEGVISGSGAMTFGDENHPADIFLTGSNSYTGGTTVVAGNFLIIGSGGTAGSIVGGVSVGLNGELIFDRSDSVTFNGTVSGQGALNQSGSGTLTLPGANTHSGGTFVGGGTLLVTNTSGSATGTGQLVVGPGATVGGTGMINASGPSGHFLIQGNVQVGAGGTDTAGELTLMGVSASSFSGSNITFNLNSVYTGLNSSGNILNVDGTPITFSTTTLTLNLIGTNIIAANTPYTLLQGDAGTSYGGLTTFTNALGQSQINDPNLILTFSTPGADAYYLPSYLFLNGNDIDVEIVPEPSVGTLLLAGLALIVMFRRSRAKAGP